MEITAFLFFMASTVIALMRSEHLVFMVAVSTINLLIYLIAIVVDIPPLLPLFFLHNIPIILLYIIVSIFMFRHIVQEKPVTHEILYGLGALYLQTGLVYAFLYDFIEHVNPENIMTSHG